MAEEDRDTEPGRAVRTSKPVFRTKPVRFIVMGCAAVLVAGVIALSFIDPPRLVATGVHPLCVEADGRLRAKECSWDFEYYSECDTVSLERGQTVRDEYTVLDFIETGPGEYSATIKIDRFDPETTTGITPCAD